MSYGGYSKPKINGSKLPWSNNNDPRGEYDFPEMFIDDEGGDDEKYDNGGYYQDKDNSKYDEVISSYIDNLPETQEQVPRHVEKRRRNRSSKRSSSSGTSNQYSQPKNALDLLKTKIQLKNKSVKIRSYEEKENDDYNSPTPDEPVKFYQVRSRKGKSQKRRQENPESDMGDEIDDEKRSSSQRSYSTEERNHPGSKSSREKPKKRGQAQRKKVSISSKARYGRTAKKTAPTKKKSGKTNSKYTASRYKQSSRGSNRPSKYETEYLDDLSGDDYETDEHMLEDEPYTSSSRKTGYSGRTSSREGGDKRISNLTSRNKSGRKNQKRQSTSRRNQTKRKGRTVPKKVAYGDDNDNGDAWSGNIPDAGETDEAHDVSNFDDVPIGGSGMYKMPSGNDEYDRYSQPTQRKKNVVRNQRKPAKKSSYRSQRDDEEEDEFDDEGDEHDRYDEDDEEEEEEPEQVVSIMKKKKNKRSVYPQKKRNRSKGNQPKRSQNQPPADIDDIPIGGKKAFDFNDFGPNSLPPGMEEAPAVARGKNDGMAGIPEYEEVVLVPCNICGRKFKEEYLERHKQNLHKKNKKKRKVFSMTEKRVGKEGKQLFTQLVRKEKRGLVKKPQSKWRKQHKQFQAALKNTSSDDAQQYDDRVPCPHCGRKFAELAAERHIPKCEKIVNKPTGITTRKLKYDHFRDRLRKDRAKKEKKENMRKTFGGRKSGRSTGSKYSSGTSSGSSSSSRYGTSAGGSSSGSSRYSGYRSTLRGGKSVGKKIRRRY